MLAISRALKIINELFKPALREAGLLTVDSRVRERRMVGTGGKARRQKQSPKR
jgi:small subunit ribosomal protein S9